MAKAMRAAIYLRVSTSGQDTANQRRELEAAAAARGWQVTAVYETLKPSRHSAMISPSACRPWQPDRAANAAQQRRCYTTARDMISWAGLPEWFRRSKR